MAREFPFLRDILLKQEAEVHVIPALLEKELNVHFTLANLPERRVNGEDSEKISTQFLPTPRAE